MKYLCLLFLRASSTIAEISDDFSDGNFKQIERVAMHLGVISLNFPANFSEKHNLHAKKLLF